jgi:hypothetical protein
MSMREGTRFALPLSALLLGGCGEAGIVRIALYSQEQPEVITEGSKYEPMVREAVSLLGYEAKFVSRRRGALTLDLVEISPAAFDGLRYGGRMLDERGCDRSAWVIPVDSQRIAHEIAHMLGLEHNEDPNNLMRAQPAPDNTDLTLRQQEIIDFNADEIGRC